MTARTAKARLLSAEPLMRCGNSVEFKQRLQWLSEGMLHNHLNSIISYVPDQREIELYRQYREELTK